MEHLVISKIEILCRETAMECELLDYVVNDFPQKIVLLGQVFVKTGWNSDRKIVHYKARR